MDLTGMIIARLDGLFPDCEIYGENVEQGFAPPCFFVREIAASRAAFLSGRHREASRFDIHYFPAGEDPYAECRAVAARLKRELEVLGGEYRGTGMSWNVADDVLHFLVDYNGFWRGEREAPRMEEVSADVRTKTE